MSSGDLSLTKVEKTYSDLLINKEKFEQGYLGDLISTSNLITLFLDECYQLLQDRDNITDNERIKLFNFIDFGHQFQNSVDLLIQPPSELHTSEREFQPTTYPEREPDYKDQSTILRFLDVLGWGKREIESTENDEFNKPEINYPIYSDPKINRYISLMQN